jgi:Domain of unknown function (DUF4276)
MSRCHVLVEGQTEEIFVNLLLGPHLVLMGYDEVRAIVVTTKRLPSGAKVRGGLSTWEKVDIDVRALLRDSSAITTTMLDFYALPDDAPGMSTRPGGASLGMVQHVESAIQTNYSNSRLIPHLSLHEFEALLYADPVAVAKYAGRPGIAPLMDRDIATSGSPEEINQGVSTAPSKRLARHGRVTANAPTGQPSPHESVSRPSAKHARISTTGFSNSNLRQDISLHV